MPKSLLKLYPANTCATELSMYCPSPAILCPSSCNVPKCVNCSATPPKKPMPLPPCASVGAYTEHRSQANAGCTQAPVTTKTNKFFIQSTPNRRGCAWYAQVNIWNKKRGTPRAPLDE